MWFCFRCAAPVDLVVGEPSKPQHLTPFIYSKVLLIKGIHESYRVLLIVDFMHICFIICSKSWYQDIQVLYLDPSKFEVQIVFVLHPI